MNQFKIFMLACLPFAIAAESAEAQRIEPSTIEWFNSLRIEADDANENGQLELTEIRRSKVHANWLYYKTLENFQAADFNEDASLSRAEMQRHYMSEMKFIRQLNEAELREFAHNFESGKLKNLAFLKKHRTMLKRLVLNNVWLRENSDLLETIFEDKKWLEMNGDVVEAFFNNQYFFVMNPDLAQQWHTHTLALQATQKEYKLFRMYHRVELKKNVQLQKNKTRTKGKGNEKQAL